MIVPLPLEAKLSVPGFALAAAISSLTLAMPRRGLMTRMLGLSASSAIGVKSRSGS